MAAIIHAAGRIRISVERCKGFTDECQNEALLGYFWQKPSAIAAIGSERPLEARIIEAPPPLLSHFEPHERESADPWA